MFSRSNRLGAAGNRWSVRQLARLLTLKLAGRRRVFDHLESACAVYLTFDDGPHPMHTPRLLDALRDVEAKATFFVVGKECKRHPEILRRIAEEGHGLGNHSYRHEAPCDVSAANLAAEIRRTSKVVSRLANVELHLFRPPYGDLSPVKLLAAWRLGQQVALWNVDPKDYARQSAGEIKDWFTEHQIVGGDVVLMHDVHPYAAEAIPWLVAEGRSRGLRFESLTHGAGSD